MLFCATGGGGACARACLLHVQAVTANIATSQAEVQDTIRKLKAGKEVRQSCSTWSDVAVADTA